MRDRINTKGLICGPVAPQGLPMETNQSQTQKGGQTLKEAGKVIQSKEHHEEKDGNLDATV